MGTGCFFCKVSLNLPKQNREAYSVQRISISTTKGKHITSGKRSHNYKLEREMLHFFKRCQYFKIC